MMLSNAARNAYWGMRWGLAFAGVFCLWAVILLMLGGPSAFMKQGISFAQAIAGYVFGGITAGAVVGILRPLLKYGWGAAVVGIIAAWPVGLAFMVATLGSHWSSPNSLITVAIFSLTVGAMGGITLREVVWRK